MAVLSAVGLVCMTLWSSDSSGSKLLHFGAEPLLEGLWMELKNVQTQITFSFQHRVDLSIDIATKTNAEQSKTRLTAEYHGMRDVCYLPRT